MFCIPEHRNIVVRLAIKILEKPQKSVKVTQFYGKVVFLSLI